MDNREKNKIIAQETLDILANGNYQNAAGETVDIAEKQQFAVENAILYTPKDTNDLLYQIKPGGEFSTEVEVTNETTLHAAKRMIDEGYSRVCVLNFASAKNPGGGFLNGSMAQEESIAYASGIYPTIHQMQEMYEYNKTKIRTCLYSDYMIYSPNVPVIRDEQYELLDQPYEVSFISSPAVNAGAVRKNEPANKNRIHATMEKRIEKILSLAAFHEEEVLILGAFGCGVFKNYPSDVAGYFKKQLTQNPKLKGKFKKIIFAVLDTSEAKQNYLVFKDKLQGI